jgi:hypothetical protein
VRGVARKSRRLLQWVAPIVAGLPLLFYVGGVLLSLGAFAPAGIVGLGAFDVSEIARAGWLNVGPTTLVAAAVWAIAAVIVWPVSEVLARAATARAPKAAPLAAQVLAIALCAYAAATADGVFQLLIASSGALLFAALTVAYLTRSEVAIQARARPFGWFLLCLGALIVLVALGEAASPLGSNATARAALFATPDGQRCVYPVLIGHARLLYADGDRLFLSDYESRSVIEVGRVPADSALRRHTLGCARLTPVTPAR